LDIPESQVLKQQRRLIWFQASTQAMDLERETPSVAETIAAFRGLSTDIIYDEHYQGTLFLTPF
jgi:hypothetical protein